MQNKRRKHFVDPAVQGAVLRRLLIHWAVFLLAAGVFLYFVEMVTGNPRDAWRNLLVRHSPTVLVVLVMTPFFLRDLCKLTNRLVSPMVCLRRAMRELAEGREVAPIRFRDGDFWNDLPDEFNRVVELVRSTKISAEDNQQDNDDNLQLRHATTGGGVNV